MSNRLARWLYRTFALAGLCLILALAYAYFTPSPAASLQVPQADPEIADAYVGESREVVYRLDNTSSRPIRILGIAECWRANCSFGPKLTEDDLKEIAPGSSDFVCKLEIEDPGEFQAQIHLFVDDQGTREIVLSVHGIAKARR